MNIKLKKYEYVKTEVDGKIFELPEVPVFYFETGIRRSIRITPVFSDWKSEQGLPEEIFQYVITCVYQSWECKIEQFTIMINDIESLYFDEKNSFIVSWINGDFNKRTQDKFESDFNNVIQKLCKN